MKPHEQEWTVACGIVRNAEGRSIATVTDPEADALIVAAPDMARALLDVSPVVGGVAHSSLCGINGLGVDKRCHYTCAAIDAALRTAGVLL